MKKRNIILPSILTLLWGTVSSQTFKTVETATDIIDNYLIAVGCVKQDTIYSYEINGTVNLRGINIPYIEYVNLKSKEYYLNINSDSIKVIKFVINDTVRWVQTYKEGKEFNIDVSDIEHKVLNTYFLDFNYFFFFLNYKKYNLDISFDSVKIDNELFYKIDFSMMDSLLCTALFDSKNYFLTEYSVEAPTENIMGYNKFKYEFYDYKQINKTNIKMPFEFILNDLFDINVNEYVFNKNIEKKLLLMPEKIDQSKYKGRK